MSPELLEDVLVELRPVPDAEWAEEMDRRVARGFREEAPAARSGKKRRRLSRTWAAPAFATGVAALLIGTVVALNLPAGDDAVSDSAGSVATTDSGGGEAEGGGAAPAAPEAAASDQAQMEELQSSRSAGSVSDDESLPFSPGGPTVPGAKRAIEYFASLTLTAKPARIADLGDDVGGVARALGGYVASSSVSSSDDGGGGQYELKVPTARLDDAIGRLSKLAHVAAQSQNTQDITGSFRSARSRLGDARTERESLLRQLAAADTVNETASIRRRLDLVAGQITGAKRELASVERRADYATLSVTLTSDADAPVGGEDDDGVWTPGDAVDDAGRILEVAAGVLVIVLAAALPIALVLALGALAARAVVRRRREQALDAA